MIFFSRINFHLVYQLTNFIDFFLFICKNSFLTFIYGGIFSSQIFLEVMLYLSMRLGQFKKVFSVCLLCLCIGVKILKEY